MSKSYRKYPLLRVEKKEDYRKMNRQLRHDKLAKLPNGGSYKKYTSRWNNWAYRWTWKQALEDYYNLNYSFKYTLEEWRRYWEKIVIGK